MDRELWKRLVALTWPIYAETLLRVLMGNVAVFMLSRYSDGAVAAVGFSNQLISLFMTLFGVVGAGTAIIVSQYHGAGDEATARRVSTLAVGANLVFGVACSLLVSAFALPLLRMLGLPAELLAQGRDYLSIVGAFLFSQALFSTMAGVSRSFGSTRMPMFVSLGMGTTNVVGCYLAVFRPFGLPATGVAGVAAASVASTLAGVVVLAVHLRRRLGIRFRPSELRPFPADLLRDILRIGAPAAGEYISYTLSQMLITTIVASLGVAVISTRIYALNLTAVVSIFSLSLGQGAQILIGQRIGAGRPEEAGRICRWSFRTALVVNVVLSLGILLLRRPLLGLFTADERILSLGSAILAVDVAIEAGRAFNHVVGNALRGAGDVRYPVVVGVLSMWGLGVAFAQGLGIWAGLGLVGIWIALAMDEGIRGLVLSKRWRSGAWTAMKVMRNVEAPDP